MDEDVQDETGVLEDYTTQGFEALFFWEETIGEDNEILFKMSLGKRCIVLRCTYILGFPCSNS